MSLGVFDRVIQAQVPRELDEQIRLAAERSQVGMSEYIRRAVAEAVRKDGFTPPPVQRRPSDRRADAILQLPECEGRKALAEHLAFETSVSVDQARAILRAASPDPVGDLARDIVADYHAAWGTRR